jgi:hypothetical protein
MTSMADTQSKWKDILDHPDLPKISGQRRAVTAAVLENTERELSQYKDHSQFLLSEAVPTNSMAQSSSDPTTGAIDTFDPILISLVRRAMPNLIAYDLCGVQQMTAPTGLVFAMRSRYVSQTGAEAFYNEPDTGASARGGANASANSFNLGNAGGVGTQQGPVGINDPGGAATNINANSTVTGIPGVSNNAGANSYNFAAGISRNALEGLGSNSTLIFPEMAFSIEKVSVEAKSRAMKAEYSMELAQDLKAIHGLDAETELSNILSTEILAEINREVVRTINIVAVIGATADTTTPGIFDLDVDSNGRWLVEKFKGLHFQLEREANAIAKQTRRGRGNVILCSSDVASALTETGKLDYSTALTSNNLQVDDTGNTFVGILNGKYRVYIDPYAIGGDYMTIGYKGSNAFDAGLFYCPYVPLQMVRAVDPNTFQPKIGFKTRYGMVANPYAEGINVGAGRLVQDSNVYYRRIIVQHLT